MKGFQAEANFQLRNEKGSLCLWNLFCLWFVITCSTVCHSLLSTNKVTLNLPQGTEKKAGSLLFNDTEVWDCRHGRCTWKRTVSRNTV